MKTLLPFALAALITTLAAGATSPATNAPSPEPATSLAIVIRAAEAGSKFLAAEYARDLIHVFDGVERLTVIPRARVLNAEASDDTPAQIGRTLPVTHVLLAIVQVTNDDFVISAELIESSSKQKLWHETIRTRLADGAGIPGKVVRAATRALGLPMPMRNECEPHFPTANPTAWRA